jgi:hypothetical protein
MIRLVSVLVLLAWCSAASAEPAGAQAEVLFREGRELMAKGKYPEACAAFEQSQKLDPALTTLLNLAGCREKNGQIATAWGLFLEAERQTRSVDDASARQLHDVAQTRAKQLETRVSKLAINVPDRSKIDRLEILRDNDSVDAVMWNRALPIDGGTYTIHARAPGVSEWSTKVTIAAEGDTKTVEIPDLRGSRRDLAPALSSKAPAHTEPIRHEEPGPSAPSGTKLLPLATGGAAVALLGSALGFSLWGDAKYDAAKAETIDQARRDALYDAANTRRYVAEGLVVAGIATAGVAVWLYLRSRKEDPAAVARQLDVVTSPTGIAVLGSF